MLNLSQIHKPTTIQDAIRLVRQPGTVVIAGGTQLISEKRMDVTAVVDLSALGLSYIRDTRAGLLPAPAVAIGATTPLADLADSPILRAAANGVLAQAAHRTVANILRNQATVAGTLITEPNGILATVLLALDALITCAGDETVQVASADFLGNPDRFVMSAIVTDLIIPAASLGKRASLETVARTPSDKPIVCACAIARIEQGAAYDIRVALGGVASSAVRVKGVEAELEGKTLNNKEIARAVGAIHASPRSGAGRDESPLSPRGDFRGSVEYRKEMAVVLTRRALSEWQA